MFSKTNIEKYFLAEKNAAPFFLSPGLLLCCFRRFLLDLTGWPKTGQGFILTACARLLQTILKAHSI